MACVDVCSAHLYASVCARMRARWGLIAHAYLLFLRIRWWACAAVCVRGCDAAMGDHCGGSDDTLFLIFDFSDRDLKENRRKTSVRKPATPVQPSPFLRLNPAPHPSPFTLRPPARLVAHLEGLGAELTPALANDGRSLPAQLRRTHAGAGGDVPLGSARPRCIGSTLAVSARRMQRSHHGV